MIDNFQIVHLSEVDSTNNFAANLIKDGKGQNNMVIMADYQSKGKGQLGNSWLSEANQNLTFSIIKNFDRMSVSEQAKITWIASISLVDLLREYGINAKVKWPNDIIVNHKKIAGILIENHLVGSKLTWSILGIGLNVNQKNFDFQKATSIKNEIHEEMSLMPILQKLLPLVSEKTNLPFDILQAEYNSELYLKNEVSQFQDSDGIFEGKIHRVNDSGFLILEKSDGRLVMYGQKELIYQNAL